MFNHCFTRFAASDQGLTLRRPAFVLLVLVFATLLLQSFRLPASAAQSVVSATVTSSAASGNSGNSGNASAAAEQTAATRVLFSLPPGLKYALLALQNPERLVVDFPLSRVPPAIKAMAEQFDPKDPLIKAVRYGQFKPGVVRVVFDLKQQVDVSAERSAAQVPGIADAKQDQQLVLRLQPKSVTPSTSALAMQADAPVPVASPGPSPSAAVTSGTVANSAAATSAAATSTATSNTATTSPTTTSTAQPALIAGNNGERTQQSTPMPRASTAAASAGRPSRPMSLSTQTGFDIGLENSEYRWRDWAGGQPYSQATSSRVGMSVGFTQVFEVDEDDVFVRVESGYSTGNTTRKIRSAVNPDALKDAGRKSEPWWDARLIVGSDWNFRDFSMVPYVGIGYRALKTTAALNLPASGSYRRDIQHHYIPIGLTLRHSLPNGARLSSNLEYDHFVSGKVTSYYAEDPETNAQAIGTVKNALKKGLGMRGSVMYEQDPWSIGPFFRFWKVGASDSIQVKSVYDVYEGINKSYEIGVNARYRF